jgi:hypothetical protein
MILLPEKTKSLSLQFYYLMMAVAGFRAGMSSGLNQTATDEELNVEEDVDAADPEANSEHFMAILVECLALLNKVPDIVEVRACFKEK